MLPPALPAFRRSARRRLSVLLLSLVPALAPAQGTGTGAIEGRVFDAGRGEYLEKALLSVEGTRL